MLNEKKIHDKGQGFYLKLVVDKRRKKEKDANLIKPYTGGTVDFRFTIYKRLSNVADTLKNLSSLSSFLFLFHISNTSFVPIDVM